MIVHHIQKKIILKANIKKHKRKKRKSAVTNVMDFLNTERKKVKEAKDWWAVEGRKSGIV